MHTPSSVGDPSHTCAQGKPFSVGFLLIENFTLTALSAAIEPLRTANQLSDSQLYCWTLIAADEGAVTSSDGVSVMPDAVADRWQRFDLVIVVAGKDVAQSMTAAEVSWLRRTATRHRLIGSVCTGAWVLASAGLLDDHDCSTHWETVAALQHDFPKVRCNDHLYTFDRNRVTCSGGSVPMHMMLTLIRAHRGETLANTVSQMLVLERIREGDELQRVPLQQHLYASHPRLAQAVQLMEANLEEPLEMRDIATYANISRRQMERLFLTHLGCTPSRYYLRLRLERAQSLLRQTSCPIVDIAAMCGFVSAPHFSRCYQRHMGRSPRAERYPRTLSAPASAQEAGTEVVPLQA